MRFHNRTLDVRIWEDAMRNATAVVFWIKEKFVFIYVVRNDKEIEIVKNILLFLLPVFVVEIIIYPHKSLVNDFWSY